MYRSNYTSIFILPKCSQLKVQSIPIGSGSFNVQQDSPCIENSEESWAARQVAKRLSTARAPAASARGLLTGYG